MASTKNPLTSMTILGGLGSFGSAVALFEQIRPELALVAAGASALMVIIGRIRAVAKIKF